MKYFLLISFLLIIIISKSFTQDSLKGILFPYPYKIDSNTNTKRETKDKLLSNLKVIEYDKSIMPGDSIEIDVSKLVDNIENIINVKSFRPNETSYFTYYKYGTVKLINSTNIKFYLIRNYCFDSVYLSILYSNNSMNIDSVIIKINNKFIDLPGCKFNGNYICNSGFEISKFNACFDVFKPFADCVGDFIQSWRGNSSDLYSRNKYFKLDNIYDSYLMIPSYFNYVYNYSPQYPFASGDYYFVPDTWDKDPDNIQFAGFCSWFYWKYNTDESYKSDFNHNEIIHQQLNIKLQKNKKFVVEFNAYIREFERFVYPGYHLSDYPFTPDSLKIEFWLGNYNHCDRNPLNYSEDGRQLVFKDDLIVDKWKQFKSKPFLLSEDMVWACFTGVCRGKLHDGEQIYYYIYIDDVYLREAGVGITSYVDNYYPCLGDIIEYKFKIWKDDPEDKNDVVLHDLLPKDFKYVGGDFTLDNDGILKTTLKGNQFDEQGIAYVSIKALVPDNPSLHGKSDTNEIYMPDIPSDYRSSTGKYKIAVHPAVNLLAIEQSIKTERCMGDTVEFTVKITNTGDENIDDLMVNLHNTDGVKVNYGIILVYDSLSGKYNEVIRPELFLNNKIVNTYGYFEGQYLKNEDNDLILEGIHIPQKATQPIILLSLNITEYYKKCQAPLYLILLFSRHIKHVLFQKAIL